MDYYKKKNLKSFQNSQNKHLANDLAIDLLANMLVYDQADRISAKEAMMHPYFIPLWENRNNGGQKSRIIEEAPYNDIQFVNIQEMGMPYNKGK